MLSSAAMESVKERAQIIENLSEQPLVGAPACASEQNKHISDSLSAMTVNRTMPCVQIEDAEWSSEWSCDMAPIGGCRPM